MSLQLRIQTNSSFCLFKRLHHHTSDKCSRCIYSIVAQSAFIWTFSHVHGITHSDKHSCVYFRLHNSRLWMYVYSQWTPHALYRISKFLYLHCLSTKRPKAHFSFRAGRKGDFFIMCFNNICWVVYWLKISNHFYFELIPTDPFVWTPTH